MFFVVQIILALTLQATLRWNKKHFSSFLRAFIEANKTIFFKGENPSSKHLCDLLDIKMW